MESRGRGKSKLIYIKRGWLLGKVIEGWKEEDAAEKGVLGFGT